MKIKKGDKVVIIGTGEQAPFGIGEIITEIPAAHHKKVERFISRWYNPPAMEINGVPVRLSEPWEPDIYMAD